MGHPILLPSFGGGFGSKSPLTRMFWASALCADSRAITEKAMIPAVRESDVRNAAAAGISSVLKVFIFVLQVGFEVPGLTPQPSPLNARFGKTRGQFSTHVGRGGEQSIARNSFDQISFPARADDFRT